MKNLLVILFLIFNVEASAENVPLPTSLSGVDDIIAEFRTQFSTKLVDLGKNYISTFNTDSVTFTHSDAIICNNIKSSAGETIAGIYYINKKAANELYEKVIYKGCNQETALVEEVVTRGTDLAPLKFMDIVKGKRSVDLKDNETAKFYKIKNELAEEIFGVQIEKRNNTKFLNFSFLGQKFLSMLFEYTTDATNVVITYEGFNASYDRKFGHWKMHNNFPTFTNRIIARRGELATYLDRNGNPMSLTSFTNRFNETIMAMTLPVLSEIIEYHTYYFPATAATKTGNQNARFVEELRKAQTRLLTNSEINLVKNLLQEFINAAELGQITDNRPKPNH